jgi:Ras-related protein Rab-2A
MSRALYDYTLKFIIVGDSSVGKSNIMSEFTDKRFHAQHELTIGVEFATKIVSYKNTNYKLQIWDTAGQETFQSITRAYYRGTIGCLLVYDITRRDSFESVSRWYADLKQYCEPNITVVLVGNKTDLEQKREVTYDEGKDFAEKHGISFFETSAKTSQNVEACFLNAVERIEKKIEDKTIDILHTKGCVPSSAPIKLQHPPANRSYMSGCYC